MRYTKRQQAEDAAYAEFQKGIPWKWQRFICPGCGADFCLDRTDHPLLLPECLNCGSHMGTITSMVVKYSNGTKRAVSPAG